MTSNIIEKLLHLFGWFSWKYDDARTCKLYIIQLYLLQLSCTFVPFPWKRKYLRSLKFLPFLFKNYMQIRRHLFLYALIMYFLDYFSTLLQQFLKHLHDVFPFVVMVAMIYYSIVKSKKIEEILYKQLEENFCGLRCEMKEGIQI